MVRAGLLGYAALTQPMVRGHAIIRKSYERRKGEEDPTEIDRFLGETVELIKSLSLTPSEVF